MSATASHTDSNLSGKPSDDIDKQKGPSTGSNVESPGNPLNAGKATAGAGQGQAGQGSTGNTNKGGQQQQQQKTGGGQ